MHVEHSISAVRETARRWRSAGQRVAFVPTMGNLHEGHLKLVRAARETGDRVVVSVFVNPLQFAPGEDLESYPRTFDADCEKLEAEGVDLVFNPAVDAIYPEGMDRSTRVSVPEITEILCGASRPGHFTGVTTVVCKLLNIVAPDVAVFGRKDYQQLVVIRKMVDDLCMPVEIMGVDTVRERDGLALSSRNGYLTESERAAAPELQAALREIVAALEAGGRDFGKLESGAQERLKRAGFRPDYVEIRAADTLAAPTPETPRFVVLGAAWLGRARLIDNMEAAAGRDRL